MTFRLRTTAMMAVAMAATVLCGTACTNDTPAAKPGAAASGLAITFRTLDAATQGDNKVEVVVKQPDGKPLNDATVDVTFRMPAMPSMNMPEMHNTVSLAPQGDGRYVGTGQLEMTGSWQVAVTVARDGAQLGTQRFTLQAK